MGCVRKRRGAWVVDYYDLGRRRVKTFATKRDAEDFKATLTRRTPTMPVGVDARITVKDFVPVYISRARAQGVRESTLIRYQAALAHVVDALGDVEVRELTRPQVEDLLTRKLLEVGSRQGQRGPDPIAKRKLARGSVRQILKTLSGMMSAAVAVQLVAVNPLLGLGRQMRLGRARGPKKILALTPDQYSQLLDALGDHPDSWAIKVMAQAGLRVGEAIALCWERHVDIEAGVLHVIEQVAGPLKDTEPRDIPMSPSLLTVLTALRAEQQKAALRAGRDRQQHLFGIFDTDRSAQAQQRIAKGLRRTFSRALKTAGLPSHFTMKSLRHTFASVHIARGVSIAAVRQWLGHSSVALTVDIYGSWLPTEAAVTEILPVTNPGSSGNKRKGAARATA